MKRRDLIKEINRIAKEKGLAPVWLEGGSHSKVGIGRSVVSVPRHTEVNEITASAILNQVRKAK